MNRFRKKKRNEPILSITYSITNRWADRWTESAEFVGPSSSARVSKRGPPPGYNLEIMSKNQYEKKRLLTFTVTFYTNA